MDLNLPNKETQERIAKALEELAQGKTPTNKTIYGIRGLGQENPILTRTYDAKGITIDLTTNGDFKEAVASDASFQEFFNFPEHTDELGNVFITITPLAFRYDLINNGEIVAISVKEYEEGDEALGFEVHSAFKKWVTETTYEGVGSIQIAKYINSAYDIENDEVATGGLGYDEWSTNPDNVRVRSVANAPTGESFAPWSIGIDVINNTHQDYGLLNWMYVDLLRMLMVIYFARTDIHNMFEIEFEIDSLPDLYLPATKETDTGNTDNMISHSGLNTVTLQYKIFNLDDLLTMTTVNGAFNTRTHFAYSHNFHFHMLTDELSIKSTISHGNVYGGDGVDIVTKMGFDLIDPAFKTAIGWRSTSFEFPEGTIQNIFYSCKSNNTNPDNDYTRGQLFVFSNHGDRIYPDHGIFYSQWRDYVGDAWYADRAARLCKPPF